VLFYVQGTTVEGQVEVEVHMTEEFYFSNTEKKIIRDLYFVQCSLSRYELAKRIGVSDASVKKYAKNLIDFGVVLYEECGCGKMKYRFNFARFGKKNDNI